jgi:hypothetical protein
VGQGQAPDPDLAARCAGQRVFEIWGEKAACNGLLLFG